MALNRYYYPTKYKASSEVSALGVTCVFISYQSADRKQAKILADYLQEIGIDIYFDVYDKDLKGYNQTNNPSKVTQAICKGVNNSTHMLVIVSPQTILSAWVPFEIGYGYDKTQLSVVCLKGIPKGGLPGYIRSSKVIRDIYDIKIYIGRLYSSMKSKGKIHMSEASSLSTDPISNIMDNLVSDRY